MVRKAVISSTEWRDERGELNHSRFLYFPDGCLSLTAVVAMRAPHCRPLAISTTFQNGLSDEHIVDGVTGKVTDPPSNGAKSPGLIPGVHPDEKKNQSVSP
jgi:hypothetical protein